MTWLEISRDVPKFQIIFEQWGGRTFLLLFINLLIYLFTFLRSMYREKNFVSRISRPLKTSKERTEHLWKTRSWQLILIFSTRMNPLLSGLRIWRCGGHKQSEPENFTKYQQRETWIEKWTFWRLFERFRKIFVTTSNPPTLVFNNKKYQSKRSL